MKNLRSSFLRIVIVLVVFNYYGVSSHPLEDDASYPSGGIDDLLHPSALASDVGSSLDQSGHVVVDYEDDDHKGAADVLGDEESADLVQPTTSINVPESETTEVKDKTEIVDKNGQEIDDSVSSDVINNGGDESVHKDTVDEVAVPAEPLVVNDDKLVDEVAEANPPDVNDGKEVEKPDSPVVNDNKEVEKPDSPDVNDGKEVEKPDSSVVNDAKEHVEEVAEANPPDVNDGKEVEKPDSPDVNDDKEYVEEVAEANPPDVNDGKEVEKPDSPDASDDKVVEKTGALVVRDDEDRVVELRGGKSYTGAVCTPSLNDVEDGIITMPPPPLIPACKAYFWTASVEEGFVPDITLESLSLDHKVGEFMIIGPGSDRDVLWVDETNPMVTANVATPKLFRVLKSHIFSVFLVTNTPTGFKGNFTLRYQPEGLIETTTEPPTTGPTLPTPGPNITAEITIYVGGKAADEYTFMDEDNSTLKDQLRGAIGEMASDYCFDNNILLLENVTADNVVFSLLRECNGAWAESSTCVQVNMSVAVHTVQPERYEMTAAHLTDMWSKIDKYDVRLEHLKLYKYEEPNAAQSMYLWLGLSIVVLALFICILMVVWRVEIWEYRRMRSKSESGYSGRSSSASTDSDWFQASEHQLVPPYMESFAEGYVEYEPEFDGPAPAPKYQTLPTVVTTPASPPRYGPPIQFGGAIHFYGNNARQNYNNAAFEEDEEDEINTTSSRGGLTMTHLQHIDNNDNSNC